MCQAHFQDLSILTYAPCPCFFRLTQADTLTHAQANLAWPCGPPEPVVVDSVPLLFRAIKLLLGFSSVACHDGWLQYKLGRNSSVLIAIDEDKVCLEYQRIFEVRSGDHLIHL